MEMRERIARAALESLYCAKLVSPVPKDWLKAADAVLVAMREPDETMADAGWLASRHHKAFAKRALSEDVWQAMIDAARSTPTTPNA